MITFQDIINQLLQFWSEKGCIIHQGHDVEVGAGTFNPATFLRSVGPEPYNCVYVEPSRRPQDGRYGDNPNRLQLFHQLQVIMKPSPDDIQKLYLESLQKIGFDLAQHDIRFVHDDWESPTLGAWGLGWEVWIDGMEVTQFTYFQSIAGMELNPIPVEITYGLERLSMLAQKKNNFFDMLYNEHLTYGDVFHRNEVEWSRYNFESSTTQMWLCHFEDYEKEAKNLINLNLPIPAYDFVMKASHAFNMLEARGVISTTERTNYIHRIRELAKLSAIEYLDSRKKLGFPLVKEKNEPTSVENKQEEQAIAFDPNQTKDFLFEICTEQLPATFVPTGMKELEKYLTQFCKEHGLQYGLIKTFGTPQRIAILIQDLQEGTHDETKERRGPQVNVAFDDNGHPTKQGEGFFQSLGLPSMNKQDLLNHTHSQVGLLEKKGKEYLLATVVEKGQSTHELLKAFLPTVIKKMSFPKTMRWGSYELSFARPIKTILALYGENIIPFQIDAIASSNLTFSHAQRASHIILIDSPKSYERALEDGYVIACPNKRKAKIEGELKKIHQEYQLQPIEVDRVMKEVLYLTEYPILAVGSFNERFLEIPKEVLISEMIEHQRYFPLVDVNNELASKFVITADNIVNEHIITNNEAVLTARLSDGAFLFKQDLKHDLSFFNEKLKSVTFHKQLGSVFDKLSRIEKLAIEFNEKLQVEDGAHVKRSAFLCKADLASEMVGEFPELQGVIGMYYARYHGEDEIVCKAISEHYLPNSEEGPIPRSNCGKIIALADKMDNLLSYFDVGIRPTSSKDPFALRRQALGIMKILIESNWNYSLSTLFSQKTYNSIQKDLEHFFMGRLKTILEEKGFKKDEIEASIIHAELNPYEIYLKAKALHEFRKASSKFNDLVHIFKRAKGQIENYQLGELDQQILQEPSEKNLYKALNEVKQSLAHTIEKQEYQQSFELLLSLQKPLADLFDQVKILDSDEAIKNNRIALLQEVFKPFKLLVDFSKLQIS